MVSKFFDELAGNAGSTAFQLFVWQVLGQLVSSAMLPLGREVEQVINSNTPNAVLSAEVLASMVVRGHMQRLQAEEQARKSGLSSDWFDLLVQNYGSPPGPEQLAEALRRGFIPESGESHDNPGYLQGIAQSDLRIEWAETLKRLATHDPTPTAAATGYIKAQLTEQEARELFAKFGGNPEFFNLEYNNLGRPPSPLEAAVMAHRGVIPWTGEGPGVVSFQQAVAESDFRTKWTEAYQKLSEYLPPPRTITAMYREGSIDEETARELLLDHGVRPDLVHAYLTKHQHTLTQRVHEVTESELLRLYEEKALTAEQLTAMLREHGYTATDIPFIIQAADIQKHNREVTAAINVVHHAYIHAGLSRNEASTDLDGYGVLPDHRDYLLGLWDIEVREGTKQLTSKQLLDALGLGLLTAADATDRLVRTGYSRADAALLVQTATFVPPDAAAFLTAPGAQAPTATVLAPSPLAQTSPPAVLPPTG